MFYSRTPFKQTVALPDTARLPDAPSFQVLAKPLEIVEALLQDLHQASDRATSAFRGLSERFVLDMNVWASFRCSYQIV